MEEEFKLYVGNISWKSTDQDLKDFFSQDGLEVLSAVILTDRATGRSRGFGFVTMASKEDMEKAIELFDGKELDGRPLKVNEARPREDRPQENRMAA